MFIINNSFNHSSILSIVGKSNRVKVQKFVKQSLKRNQYFKVKSHCSTSSLLLAFTHSREPSYPLLFVNNSGSKTPIGYFLVTDTSASSTPKVSFAVVEAKNRKASKSHISSRLRTPSLAKAHKNRDRESKSAREALNYTMVRLTPSLGISHSRREGQFTTVSLK
jgi:hypothetical protein